MAYDNEEIKAKSCPFCKHGNSIILKDYSSYFVMCSRCNACGPRADNEFFAIIIWNERFYH